MKTKYHSFASIFYCDLFARRFAVNQSIKGLFSVRSISRAQDGFLLTSASTLRGRGAGLQHSTTVRVYSKNKTNITIASTG